MAFFNLGGGKRPSAQSFNLLDLRKSASRRRSRFYWLSLVLSIAVHGGFLTYVLNYARMPGKANISGKPVLVRVEIAALLAQTPLTRSDSENLPRTHASPPDLDVEQAAAPVASGQDEEWAVLGDLPEDVGTLGAARAKSLDHRPALRDRRQTAGTERTIAAQSKQIKGELREIGGAPRETRLSFDSAKENLTHRRSPPGSEDASRVAVALPPFNPAPEPDAAGLGAHTSLVPLPKESARLALFMPPLPESPRQTQVPIPVRRAAYLMKPESDRDANAGMDKEAANARVEQRPGDASVLAYRAKVRAHLAANKPSGGPQPGSVLVGFTLSRTGRLTARRILRSSGKSALDESVLEAVRRSEPFPGAPKTAKGGHLRFAIPFQFR